MQTAIQAREISDDDSLEDYNLSTTISDGGDIDLYEDELDI